MTAGTQSTNTMTKNNNHCTASQATDIQPLDFTLPAEWQGESAIILAWPHPDTDWHYMLDDIHRCYISLVEAISQYHTILILAPDISVPREQLKHLADRLIFFIQIETNDTWTRDYGPISTVDINGKVNINDFAFNGWGLKFAADRDNLVTSKLHEAGLFEARRINRLGFILEGGAIDSDGCGTLLTTTECLMSPNRNGDLDRVQIDTYLRHALGMKRILWIDHGYLAGDDTDSHVDTLARFAPGDTIIYVAPPDSDDEHYQALCEMEQDIARFSTPDGRPYNRLALPLPHPIYDEDGTRLPATYANFLATNRAVFVPTYNQPDNDRLALDIIRVAFGDRPVIGIDCNALIRQHGSLHCATMQIPRQILPR